MRTYEESCALIDQIVGRCVREAKFASLVLSDPEAALAEYELNEGELEDFRVLREGHRQDASEVWNTIRAHITELRGAGVVVSWMETGRPADTMARMVPVAVNLAERQIELLDLEGATYQEPFLHQTIERWRRQHPGARGETAAIEFLFTAARYHGRAPDGFIFHTGRCGSTLLANMLAASGEHLLIKEPVLVNDLAAQRLTAEAIPARRELEAFLAAALRCLSATAGKARYKVFKFAAWNVRLAGTLLKLFPGTPAVFLYRSPAEMVASMLFQHPAWFDIIHCPRQLQTRFFPTLREVPAPAALSAPALFAHAWRSAAEAALAQPAEQMLLLEYREMTAQPAEAIHRVLAHLRHRERRGRMKAMVAAGGIYSKDPLGRAAFDPDGIHRRPPLSPADEAEVEAIAGETWRRLEARRKQPATGFTPRTASA